MTFGVDTIPLGPRDPSYVTHVSVLFDDDDDSSVAFCETVVYIALGLLST